jgi:hypothetical protein
VRADLWVLGVLALAVTVVGCSDQTMSAADYVKAHTKDANSVVVSVQEIQQATGIYADAPDPAAAVTLQGIMSDAKDSFEKVKQSMLAPDTRPSGLEEARDKMYEAVDQLSTAIDSDKVFVDDQKSSELTDFGQHWKRGRAEWNEAVAKIWNAAGETPPTVDAG